MTKLHGGKFEGEVGDIKDNPPNIKGGVIVGIM